LSDKDKQPISQVFHCKKTSSKKLNNLNKDDKSLVTQLQGNQSKKSSKKHNTNQLSQKKSNIDSSPMAFTSVKDPKRPNVLEGKMFELNDDHETRQVFVEKKIIPADVVGNSLVIPIDQDIACPYCFKNTSLYGFNIHTCSRYLYCYKFDRLQQYEKFTIQKKIVHEDLQQFGESF
jgi:hypothetical protein